MFSSQGDPATAAPGSATAAPDVDADIRPWRKAFWALTLTHVVIWTLTPLLLCPNASLDSVEMVYWGREWQLGATKHPPLVAWVAASIVTLTGSSVWGLYLAAQLAIAVCFWSAWRLGLEVAGPRIALWGVAALEGSLFLTFEGTVLNNNVGLYPFWALAIVFFYWALKRERTRDWLATGLCIGLGLLCKYSMAILPLVFALFLIWHPRSRPVLKRPGPYLALCVAGLTFLPHLCWTVAHGFPTLIYALNRTHGASPILGRLAGPMTFTMAELVSLLPLFLIVLPLVGLRPRWRRIPPERRWDRDFLLAMTCGPFALLLLVSLVGNARFRGMHGSHLWPFAGLTMLWTFDLRARGADTRLLLGRAALAGTLLVVAFAMRSTLAPFVLGRTTREQFPGARLAAEVERLWQERYGCPLALVGGDEWLAGNVAFYSGDCPRVHEHDCNWRRKESFSSRGGVLLWDASIESANELPAGLKDWGPIEFVSPVSLRRQTTADVPPALIGIAIIAPPGVTAMAPPASGGRPARTDRAVAERLDASRLNLR